MPTTGTSRNSFRCDKPRWNKAIEAAREKGTTLTAVLNGTIDDLISEKDIVQEAVTALAPFYVKSEFRARTLLSMWARRKELTEDEFQRVLKEVTK